MSLHSALLAFFSSRVNPVDVLDSTRLVDVLDSLSFLDFFLFLEESLAHAITLDEVAGCETLGDLSRLLGRGAAASAC